MQLSLNTNKIPFVLSFSKKCTICLNGADDYLAGQNRNIQDHIYDHAIYLERPRFILQTEPNQILNMTTMLQMRALKVKWRNEWKQKDRRNRIKYTQTIK